MQLQLAGFAHVQYRLITTLFFILVEADRERGFHLDIEDYLSGVLILASELVRKIFMHIFGLKLTLKKKKKRVMCFLTFLSCSWKF